MRLITCSNSAPSIDAGTGELIVAPGSPGGLLPIMISLLGEVDGHWIFTAPASAGPEPTGSGRTRSLPIVLDERLAAAHYSKISISTFLWLFHYVFDTTYEPTFSTAARADWSGYETVNRLFADEMIRHQDGSTDEILLVHDFHFMLVPGMIQERSGGRRSRLVYFHHVPWCEPDYFALLPEWMRTPVLESLLASDVVGFHCTRWAEAFIACCERFVDGVEVSGMVVKHRSHQTSVAVAPGPIDADTLRMLKDEPITQSWRERLLRRADGRRPIVRVDRLDLWKNVIRGFEAFELLLERDKHLAEQLWFCGIVSAPRKPTERSIAYRARCEATAQRINDRFGVPGREPVSLLYPDGDHTRHRAVAALEVSAVTLVNPTLDGLNMVAKEALVVGSAPLLLSRNAGAFEQLRDGVLPVQPYDIEGTAAVMRSALDGARSDGAEAMHGRLSRETAAGWLWRLLADHPPG